MNIGYIHRSDQAQTLQQLNQGFGKAAKTKTPGQAVKVLKSLGGSIFANKAHNVFKQTLATVKQGETSQELGNLLYNLSRVQHIVSPTSSKRFKNWNKVLHELRRQVAPLLKSGFSKQANNAVRFHENERVQGKYHKDSEFVLSLLNDQNFRSMAQKLVGGFTKGDTFEETVTTLQEPLQQLIDSEELAHLMQKAPDGGLADILQALSITASQSTEVSEEAFASFYQFFGVEAVAQATSARTTEYFFWSQMHNALHGVETDAVNAPELDISVLVNHDSDKPVNDRDPAEKAQSKQVDFLIAIAMIICIAFPGALAALMYHVENQVAAKGPADPSYLQPNAGWIMVSGQSHLNFDD